MVVVIDLSASMKAKGSSGTRFEAARQRVSITDRWLGVAIKRCMVIGAGAQPRLLAPFTADKRRLREMARNISATDAPGRVKEAILFAHAFLKRDTPDQVVVISDGAFDGAEEYSRPAGHLRFIKVEGGNNNIGIVGLRIAPSSGTPVPSRSHGAREELYRKSVRVFR